LKIKEILSSTDHRPWPIPHSNWSFYQEWNDVIFLHWQVEREELEKFVPKELELDLFDGKPWVSIVAFTMEKIRPKNIPSFSPISNFDEINIRTYVKANNKTGVYFLSIEGGTKLSCEIAKGISGLPYRYSKMSRTKNQYISTNEEFEDNLRIEFQAGDSTQTKTNLDKWLTERYALFLDDQKSIKEFEIHHLKWQIKELILKEVEFKYERFSNLIKNAPSKIQYSNGVKVIAWNKKKI